MQIHGIYPVISRTISLDIECASCVILVVYDNKQRKIYEIAGEKQKMGEENRCKKRKDIKRWGGIIYLLWNEGDGMIIWYVIWEGLTKA